MHCNQPDLVARLFAIEIQGLQERHFDLSADTFVTVSVDGEQQIQTELVENNLNPKWKFAMPYTLMVHASSVISFQVYRRRNVAKMFGAKYIGRLEQKLYTFVTNPNVPFDINIRMNTMHWEKAKLMAVIDVDYTTPVETLLDHAEDKLHGATMNATDRDLTPAAEAIRSLGHAIGSLDQLMGFVDGIVDIHPIAKAAWMLLSSVYKAVQAQTAQDSAIKELADSLKETLTHARSCRNVHKIPGAKDAVQELARLTAEGASLLDECMKHTMILRVAKAASSKTLYTRIGDCTHRLKKLRESLALVLLVNIQNDVADIKDDLRERHPRPPAAETAPLPGPSHSTQRSVPSQASYTPEAAPSAPPPPPPLPRPLGMNDTFPIGHNYQPVYTTFPDTYYTSLPPVRPTSPMPAFSDRRDPMGRPASPWPPHLDTGSALNQSPTPMLPPSQPYGYDSCPQRPFPMPSPSSSMSSVSCFSMEDDAQTTSSQSSYPTTPFDETLGSEQILLDQPLVEEPEDGLCCSHTGDCRRSQSLKRQKEVQKVGHAMLWGPSNNMVRSCSS